MWAWLKQKLFAAHAPRPSTLLPIDQFRTVLTLERLRSDRTGEAFALLSFKLHGPGSAPLLAFAQLLERRLRATDVAGLLEGGQVGAMLPATLEAGARKLAEDLCALFAGSPAGLTYEVYVYGGRDSASPDKRPARKSAQKRQPAQPLAPLLATRLPLWKRSLDVLGAVLGLIVLSPLLLLIAGLIKATSRGPVVFCQDRAGLGGRPFTMLKFRTMHVGADKLKASLRQLSEQDGPAFKMKDDPRTTALGRILRQTSLDELPQLWNVLRGEMSLVGPRPLPVDESDSCQTWYRRRLDATPGLTCIWQVDGRSSVPFEEWMRMDARYVRSYSPVGDLLLLLRTLPAVLLQKGAR
jgi:lipopolysaccharide/colanic/teichoic acid biosynthesis glycosyltransferase